MISAVVYVSRIICCVWDHPYITSAKGLGGSAWEMVIFADVYYCIYADTVGGSEKVQKYAEIVWDGPF